MDHSFYKLTRVTEPYSEREMQHYLPWADCVTRYGNAVPEDTWSGVYSKTAAIRALHEKVKSGALAKDEALTTQVRMLLTDCGLLFPQTRERSYLSVKHSMKRHRNVDFYGNAASSLADGKECAKDRLLHYGEQEFNRRTSNCEMPYSFIPQDIVALGLNAILKDFNGTLPKIKLLSDDVGYHAKQLDQATSREEAVAIMLEWLKTVYLEFDNSVPTQAAAYLSSKVNFSIEELYAFLAHILPACLWKEQLYQEAKEQSSAYQPMLLSCQEKKFSQQVHAFQEEDLSVWKNAYSALKQYLSPPLERFRGNINELDAATDPMTECVKLLKATFEHYLAETEPNRKNRPPDLPEEAAIYFVESYDGKTPLFLDQPGIIFQVFRSPVHRYLYQRIDRNWNLERVIREACCEIVLPITIQSLDADRALFYGILKACEKGCAKHRLPFEKEAWESLWICIEQAVQCLPFQKEDLLSVEYRFRGLLRFHKGGYPLLDRYMEKQLMSENPPVYLALWRTLVNGCCAPSMSKRSEVYMNLSQQVQIYRTLFEDPTAEEADLWPYLEKLCAQISWNKISVAPTRQEWNQISMKGEIPVGSRNKGKVYQVIRKSCLKTGTKGKGKKIKSICNIGARDLELVWMEWLLLQMLCDQARRELMECVLLLLEPEQGKQPV